jgi:hypothetical protein
MVDALSLLIGLILGIIGSIVGGLLTGPAQKYLDGTWTGISKRRRAYEIKRYSLLKELHSGQRDKYLHFLVACTGCIVLVCFTVLSVVLSVVLLHLLVNLKEIKLRNGPPALFAGE